MTADKVSVAQVTRDDAPSLIAANRDNRDYHHPWVAPLTDQQGFDAWFAQMLTGANFSLIARATSGDTIGSSAIIGIINLSQIVLGNFASCYCGFYGMRNQSERGLMTEAMRQAIAIAWTGLGLHRVEANIQPDNQRSIALVQRLGFQLEGFSPRYLRINGVWRDHQRWALVRDN